MATHAHTTITDITRRRAIHPAGGVLDRRNDAAQPSPLDAQFVPAADPIAVTLRRPLPGGDHETIPGILLGAMRARGEVHHYRVSVGGGLIYLAPRSWLAPASLSAVDAALAPVGTDCRSQSYLTLAMREMLTHLRARREAMA